MNTLSEGLRSLSTMIVAPIANLAARVYVGLEFFRSGMTKIMAVVIEFIVFKGSGEYTQHYYWMIIFALLVSYGGDKLSIDNLILKKRDRRY